MRQSIFKISHKQVPLKTSHKKRKMDTRRIFKVLDKEYNPQEIRKFMLREIDKSVSIIFEMYGRNREVMQNICEALEGKRQELQSERHRMQGGK